MAGEAAPARRDILKFFHNAWKHFCTIGVHKREVMRNCFRIGLYRQGILHDLSKYSWTEFKTGIKYYQGFRSPNTAERMESGVSRAWLHHKGRNLHHFEYWYDYDMTETGRIAGCRMPYRYVAEMFCDRVAASKVYKGAEYTDQSPWEYYAPRKERLIMHEITRSELEELLWMLKEKGEEETFSYLREKVKRRRKDKDYF